MYSNGNHRFQNDNKRKRMEMEDEINRFEKEISSNPANVYQSNQQIIQRPSLPAMFIPPQIQRQQQQNRLIPPQLINHQLPPRPILPTGLPLTVQPNFLAQNNPHLVVRPTMVNQAPAFKPLPVQPQFIQTPQNTNTHQLTKQQNSTNSTNTTTKPQAYTVTPMGLPTNVHNVSNPVQPSTSSNKKQKSNDNSKGKKQKKIVRTAGGQTWEDQTLLEWDNDDFRIFCGDLGNDVNEDILTRAFNKYPSFVKCKVVRDRRTNKSKGYGFISFKEPGDFIKAMRDMDGKYVGSRPIKLRRSNWKDRNIEVVKKKIKEKQKLGLI